MFKIHGTKRRQLKKELNKLKLYVKNFWYYHELEKDMISFYGSKETYHISDEDAQIKINNTKTKIKKIKEQLSIIY